MFDSSMPGLLSSIIYFVFKGFYLFECVFSNMSLRNLFAFFFKALYLFDCIFLYIYNEIIYILFKGLYHLHEMRFKAIICSSDVLGYLGLSVVGKVDS